MSSGGYVITPTDINKNIKKLYSRKEKYYYWTLKN